MSETPSDPSSPAARPGFRVSLRGSNEAPYELLPTRVEATMTLGRDASAHLRIDDARVSRRHAELRELGGTWFVADLGSTAGTFVDGRKLRSDEQVRLRRGTLLGIGPYDLRFTGGSDRSGEALSDPGSATTASVGAIPADELSRIATRRLGVIVSFAGVLQGTTDEEETLDRLAEALASGTGFTRTLLLREGPDGVRRLAARVADAAVSEVPVSSSLLAHARRVKAPVRLEEQPDLQGAMSIVQAGVTAALCLPVLPASDDAASDQLVAYLDAPGGTGRSEPDAAAFGNALAELARLSLSAIERRMLEGEMNAMHAVQRKIMPPETGRLGAWRYVMGCKPGRGAAGDVFAICGTETASPAMLLGDVSGKGPAAAMIMAAGVAHLDASLHHGTPLPHAIALLGDRICRDFFGQRFITAVAGRFADDGTATLIDAGHGFALRISAAGEVATLALEGGIGIGMMSGADYDSSTLRLAPGERLVLFTDGVTEQQDPAGRMLEMDGAAAALAGSTSPEEDVRRIFAAVRAHAARPVFSDDVTVASFAFDPGGGDGPTA